MTRRKLLLVCASIAILGLERRDGATQVQIEDRELRGQVGFTNNVLSIPGLSEGSIAAQSIGLSNPFNNIGVVYGGTPLVRDHAVVVHAFDNGQYWLTTVLGLGAQTYRFGYAANTFAAPGYPNFVNDVFRPVSVPVTPESPDPITVDDLLECAARARIHFVESDGQGAFRAPGHVIGGTVTAHPRLDPADVAPPFEYRSGPVGDPAGGAQASGNLLSTGNADLFVRSSAQAGGPEVRYRLTVAWRFGCPEIPDPCFPPYAGAGGTATFEGVGATFGTFGPGGMESTPGDNPGVLFACEETQDFYVVVPPTCVPSPPCPKEFGTIEGCVNLIGERELAFMSRTSAGNAFDVTNTGESPVPFSDLFDQFDLTSSEGIYRFDTGAGSGTLGLQSRHALNPLAGVPQILFDSPGATASMPAANETVTGPDFCMVPGIYSGTITLRDASPGGVATGATQNLLLPASRLYAFGDGGGTASRDFRSGLYDLPTGTFVLPYENIFANPDHSVMGWSQPRMEHLFLNPSTDAAFFTSGGSRIEFAQPTGAVIFDPQAFISTAAGGSWIGSLEPGTQIASRDARTLPVEYDICYGTLRVQINTHNALFFDPRISSYAGSHVDDAGTPSNPGDDTIYGVFPRQEWTGSPPTIAEAANVGFVNLRLPKGLYTGIDGTIRTVLGPGLSGVTELPAINLDVDLDCGDSCTVIPDAILCLTPIDRCNDPSIVGSGMVEISGTLNHTRPVARGFYRVNNGPEVPIDLAAAGVTCSPAPCSDVFTLSVSGFAACRNRIEIAFVDQADNPISAFLATTLDTAAPVYHVASSVDPAQPVYVCGTTLNFSPTGSCDSVPRSQVPFPVPVDGCSADGDPDSPLIQTSDAPDFFAPGTTLVHLASVDSCGNGTSCDVPVVIDDTTPPQIQCGSPGGFTFIADAQCGSLATIAAVIADNCDQAGALTVTNQVVLPGGGTVNSAGGSVTMVFPLGASTVTFTAIDSKGNTGQCSVPVKVVDKTPPVLKCPMTDTIGLTSPQPWLDGILLMVDGNSTLANYGGSTITHLSWSGGTSPYTVIRVPMPLLFGRDPQMATLGTALMLGQPVNDFYDPTLRNGTNYFYRVFQQGIGIGTFECESPNGATVDWLATVTDNCAIASVSNTRTGATLDASDLYPLGETPVDFSSEDTSANTAQCSTKVRVVDTVPPVIQCPAPLTLTIADPAGISSTDAAIQAWLAGAVASDLCGPTTVAHDAPGLFPVTCSAAGATTTVTFTATDGQGLTAPCTSTLTVILDQDSDGFPCGQDCNDTRADTHPGAPELCDGVDNDCNGTVDGFATSCGLGPCAATGICTAGVDSCTPGTPTAELCNNIDDDCDGTVDGFPTSCGVGGCSAAGVCTAGVDSCTPGTPAEEVCNTIDDDCDGTVDEGCGAGKVTGGGEIDVPGGFANYGFIVQRKTAGGPVTGQLEYYNHARTQNVHSVEMLTLIVSGTTATFTGTCTKNQQPCTFTVTVEDNGEPGRHFDRFMITVSGEPVEGDTGPIIRGNIQIHGL